MMNLVLTSLRGQLISRFISWNPGVSRDPLEFHITILGQFEQSQIEIAVFGTPPVLPNSSRQPNGHGFNNLFRIRVHGYRTVCDFQSTNGRVNLGSIVGERSEFIWERLPERTGRVIREVHSRSSDLSGSVIRTCAIDIDFWTVRFHLTRMR
jgi:mRNA-degrading endonuclease RelE of RelBE toxin-antitoxin system